MLRKNRYKRIFTKRNPKKVRKSKPLERSVHINEERWGWEYAWDRMYGCTLPKSKCKDCIDGCRHDNPRVKIVSPDNRYFEVKAEEFYEPGEWPCGQKYISTRIEPGKVKKYIIENLLTITEKEYRSKKLEREVA